MKPGDLVILTLSRNSIKKGSFGLVVSHLFGNSKWFACFFDGNLITVHESVLQVIND